MKLYTKQGDKGQTQLFGGQRVSKDDLRVEAYGTVDELNAVVGLCASICTEPELREMLTAIQNRLFEVGADLATPRAGESSPASANVPTIGAEQIAQAEQWIDRLCSQVAPMRYFVLPGGTELSARLHQARTVCRRAERRVVSLSKVASISDALVVYLNRLSDLFFAMARRANAAAGVEDVPWVPRTGS